MKPTIDQARAFAIMLQAGVPGSVAISYFSDATDPHDLKADLESFCKSKEVARQMRILEGAAWEDLSLEEKCHRARNMHYAGLAYYLYSNHYAEVGPTDQAKLDKARAAVDTFLAGRAGADDPLTEFFNDLRSGKIKAVTGPQIGRTGN